LFFEEWFGQRGFGKINTTRRDRLPADIPGKYLHKEKTDASHRTKVARFHQPVVAVKAYPPVELQPATATTPAVMSLPYLCVHISFQSTSSTNFSTVNALNTCTVYKKHRDRGIGANKQTWGIKMNNARELYLQSYSRIDSIDHLIKNCNLKYVSWKYWHQAMLHAFALAIVSAYDMYKECATASLPEWRKKDIMSFKEFRLKLGQQMLEYDPKDWHLPGDERMRSFIQMTSEKRNKRASNNITPDDLKKASSNKKSWCCGDLNKLSEHLKSKVGYKDKRNCVVCGKACYTRCELCGEFMHFGTGKNDDLNCHVDWHNSMMLGLCRKDLQTYHRRPMSEYKTPTKAQKKMNSDLIQSYMRECIDFSEF